jgi:hypothetical protein
MLIGVPAVGKSSLIRALLNHGDWIGVGGRVPHYINHDLQLCVIGKDYETSHQFPGTDRLSMGIQPYALQFILERGGRIIFEGDRLGNGKMVNYLLSAGQKVRIGHVTVTERELLARRAVERNQNPTFLKGRSTKVAGIVAQFPSLTTVLHNDRPSDEERNVEWLLS